MLRASPRRREKKVPTASNADVRANGRVFFQQSADTFWSSLQYLLASVWEVQVGWLRFKVQTDPAEASKAIIEELHQRAGDIR